MRMGAVPLTADGGRATRGNGSICSDTGNNFQGGDIHHNPSSSRRGAAAGGGVVCRRAGKQRRPQCASAALQITTHHRQFNMSAVAMPQYLAKPGNDIGRWGFSEQAHQPRDVGARMHNVAQARRFEAPLHGFTRNQVGSRHVFTIAYALAIPRTRYHMQRLAHRCEWRSSLAPTGARHSREHHGIN